MLDPLARLKEMQLHVGLLVPEEHCLAGHLVIVVEHQCPGHI